MGIKYSVNQKFFTIWSKEMAYVLGYFCADGSLEYAPSIRGRYVRFTSTDKELVETVRRVMCAEHILNEMQPAIGKKRYLLRIGDAYIFESLNTIHGLEPRKSLTMRFPDVPEEFLADFVRGYFDGDGCVSIEYQRLKNGTKSIKRLHTSFTSGSETFLEILDCQLQHKLNITSKLYKNGNTKQLRYSTASSVQLFKFMYTNCKAGLALERKRLKFHEFFQRRGNWIDMEIQTILSRHEERYGRMAKR